MRITHIHVTAGTGFNHPHESYSNFKPSVSLTATLEEWEDAAKSTASLQMLAQSLVIEEKERILAGIEREREIADHVSWLKNLDPDNWAVKQIKSREVRCHVRASTLRELVGTLERLNAKHLEDPASFAAPPTLVDLIGEGTEAEIAAAVAAEAAKKTEPGADPDPRGCDDEEEDDEP